jgi:hypothetical protein
MAVINAIGRAVRSFWTAGVDFCFPPDDDNEDDGERRSVFEDLLTFLHLK